MSIGLGKSYQHAGLNRVGAYLEPSRTKGPPADRNVCSTLAKPNEIWRRVTGIFPGVKQTAKARKRGLKLLTLKISERVRRAAQGTEPRASASGGLEISVVNDWEFEAATWTRVLNCGVTVEELCVELGCRRHILNALLKEYCGMNVSDFLDGLKFSRLKSAMHVRLREAAAELWGFPGSYVAVKLMNGGLSQRREDAKNGKNGGGKRSRYFQTRPQDLFEESRDEERVRRVTELCAMMRCDFHLESWAISLGYESGAKLKCACLNVLGRTLEKLERALAAEVVQFYFCAEDRQLREIACSDRLSVEVGRARELYHGSDEVPAPPFLDEYAKYEGLKARWLSKLWELFNGEYGAEQKNCT
jgi:hypothetical protein